MSSTKEKIWGQFHPPADPTHLSFKGKTVLVTGANSGLGHEVAVKYAQLGASKLILGVRSQEKGEQAKADIVARTRCAPDIFVIELVDLSTFASVKCFAERVKAQVSQLHVVQLAAGTVLPNYKESADGYEMTLQVNVLSTALMALLLLPKVQETAALISDGGNAAGDGFIPHISFLNSIATFEVEPDWVPRGQSLIQRCDDESKWDQTRHYFLTKLAN